LCDRGFRKELGGQFVKKKNNNENNIDHTVEEVKKKRSAYMSDTKKKADIGKNFAKLEHPQHPTPPRR
jgi:hypothetical protein